MSVPLISMKNLVKFDNQRPEETQQENNRFSLCHFTLVCNRFSRDRAVGVEQTLAIISLTGLIAFAMFNIVAAIFSPVGSIMAVTILSNLFMLLQVSDHGIQLTHAAPGQ